MYGTCEMSKLSVTEGSSVRIHKGTLANFESCCDRDRHPVLAQSSAFQVLRLSSSQYVNYNIII